jgi:hypothetical protein
MDDVSLRVVTDDDETPKKNQQIDPFVEVRFRLDPYEHYYLPDENRWLELLGYGTTWNKIFLRRDKDTVHNLKILLSATFVVDVAVENIQLQILQENMPGTGNYIPCHLNDDNIILGLHQAVKDCVVWIWVSKKTDMKMWSVLEHKIDDSTNKMERLWHKDILDDAMKWVEDNWLIFVTKKEISEIIGDILDYTLLVWWEGGEKEKF